MIKIRNITLSAAEDALKKAREKATGEGKSLNVKFREWLQRYISPQDYSKNYESLMQSLKHVSPGQKFSRDEANER